MIEVKYGSEWGDGALIQFMILMELVCGELLDRDGHLCQAIFYMKLGME